MNRTSLASLPALLVSASLASAQYQAYPGPERPEKETAIFYYKGDGGITPRTAVYKIDGETRRDLLAKKVLPYGYNKTHAVGGFALALLPGEHTFEIVLHDRKSPFSKDATRVEAKLVRLRMESGGRYRLRRDGFAVGVVADSDASAAGPVFGVENVPTYEEPAETAPHATLVYERRQETENDPYLVRIDGRATAGPGVLQGINYSLPVVFKTFNGENADLNLFLTPGAHDLEIMVLGKVIEGVVQHVPVTLEAGKKYRLELEKEKAKESSSVAFIAVRLVEI
jgi:hypothetical protein